MNMGIPGLTSFIDENPHLLTDYKLFNTKVVIDGNNLYHFLYNYFNVDNICGGDYDTFGKCVKSYFKKLIACNIDSYVVFDGAYHPDDRKLQSCFSRAQSRIALGGSISPGDRGKILPILAQETFRTVLDELGINHVTCDFEADRQLTALANEYSCPVMSNDSDFFVYDIKSGFVLLDYMNLHVHCEDQNGEKVKYLKVQIYFLQKLLSYFPGFNKEVIPLFASILGNDYVPAEEFDGFFARARLPRANTKDIFHVPKRHTKFLSLLLWLENEESLELAVESAMKYIHASKKNKVSELVMKSVTEYTKPQTTLSFELKRKTFLFDEVTEIRSKAGNLFPNWFICQARVGLIPTVCLNAAVTRRVILKCQVENTDEISAYSCAQKLREILYGLILSIDKVAGETPADGLFVTEYTRHKNELKKIIVMPMFQWQCASIQSLHDMTTLENRRDFVMKLISGNQYNEAHFEEVFTEELLLSVLALAFWVENANPQVSELHLKSLVLCIIFLWLKSANLESKSRISSEETDTFYGIANSDITKAIKNLEKFGNPCKILKFDRAVVHAFSQYQSCLQAVIYLNQLFLCPFVSPNPAKIISGTLFYNINRELKSRKCPDLYIEELIGRSSTVLNFFKHILVQIITNLSDKGKLLCCVPGRKKAKKRGGTKKSSTALPDETIEMADGSESACDTNNKFNVLMNDDNPSS